MVLNIQLWCSFNTQLILDWKVAAAAKIKKLKSNIKLIKNDNDLTRENTRGQSCTTIKCVWIRQKK